MATTKVSTKLLETVGVAEGGTGATSTSAARTSLGLVIGTNVLAPGGDGSSLTGIAGGATDAEKSNIMLNAFRISVNGGLSVQNMVDGVVDEFEDETGVDTSTSTNETYDATKDLYENPAGDDQTEAAFSAVWNPDTFGNGNANFQNQGLRWTSANAGTVASGRLEVGAYTTQIDVVMAVYTDNSGSPGTRVGGNSDELSITTTGIKTLTWSSDYPVLSAATLYWIVITDNSVSGNVTLERRSSQGSYIHGTHDTITSITAGSNVTASRPIQLELTTNTASSNMTLVSNAATALAAPGDANIVIWQEDVDSVTLNTDLKAYVSRNGGTTYTQMTLSEKTSIPVVGEGYTTDQVPTMTSNTAPTGVASASNEGSTAAWYAFDDDAGTRLNMDTQVLPAWVKYDFGSGVTKTIRKITWKCPTGGGEGPIKDFTFEGSSDDSAWTTVSTIIGANVNTLQTETFSNTTAYRYYRFYITTTYETNNNNPDINEIEMMENTISSTRILSGSVDISGQSSGTSMKYKIETLNAKEQKIHAVALQWS